MHPAYSVILFTVASGAGYGMLFTAALLLLAGRLPLDSWFAWPLFVIAFGLVSAGLLSSLLHLGHPERFLKALTQWRSSWLSREGILAIATYAPAGLFALGWLFVVDDPQEPGGVMTVLAVLVLVLCAATVFCTSMIYASLVPIREWRRREVPAVYLVLSLATGGALVFALGALTSTTSHLAPAITLAALIAGLVLKLFFWRGIRYAAPIASGASAIGMASGTPVRLLDPPNTEPNYLQKEMGYRVARKHADKLRRIAYAAGFAVPIAAILLSYAFAGVAGPLAVVAALACVLGIAIERWLFFAEATHTVMLYYDRAQMEHRR